MKNKPLKHKEENTFRYKSFGELIAEIDIRKNALYHIEHTNQTGPDDDQTHFHQAVEKWSSLNLSEEYNGFQKTIRGIVTLPQLIHKQHHVIKVLLEAIAKATTLSLEPLLDLVIQLAKDLREEFYPHFKTFFDTLVSLLHSKDAEQVAWTHNCLACLFKHLKTFLKKDISIVFNAILPLLENRQPEHVTKFAAESFSFVARDLRDKEKFLAIVLKSVRKHKNGISGCGKLLFDIMRGVAGQFHSCAEAFLVLLFESFARPKADQQLLSEILSQTVFNILKSINPKSMSIFWKTLCLVLDKLMKNVDDNGTAIEHLLTIMTQAIEFNNGRHIHELDQLVKSILLYLDADLPESGSLKLSKTVSLVLQSSCLNITQLDASRLCKNVLATSHRSVFQAFTWDCVHYSQFEILIFPQYIRLVEQYFDKETLELLVKIILEKSPLSQSGMNLDKWQPFPIKFKQETTTNKLTKLIENINHKDPNWDANMFLNACVILPHVTGADKAVASNHLRNILNELTTSLTESTCSSKMSFVLLIVVETLFRLEPPKLETTQLITNILPLCNSENKILLYLLDLLLTCHTSDRKHVNEKMFNAVHDRIADNLSSPYHQIRLLTAHTLNLFSSLPALTIGTDQSIYEIFYEAEQIVASVQTYREKLVLLQRLSTDTQLFQNIKGRPHCYDAVRYLLGVLFVNFKLLWTPTTKLLASYASELDTNKFWELFKAKLDNVTNFFRHNNLSSCEDCENLLLGNSFDSILSAFKDTNERPDMINYRVLLWRAIPEFGNISEVKNKDLVTIFLDFMDNEYRKSKENDSIMWNILKGGSNASNDYEEKPVDELDEDEETINEELNKSSSKSFTKKPQKPKKAPLATQRTLIAMLSVFKTQPNPKQLFKEAVLYNLYLELLVHKNPEVQKTALDCLLTYKHKWMIPYKENLHNFIDEAKFKDEINTFKMTQEGGTVQDEHRIEFVPILLRILYSKMMAKTGTQKGGNQYRKSLIMRFMGDCTQEEVLKFVKMAFDVYLPYLKSDAMDIVTGIQQNMSLESMLSPRKLTSSVMLIEVIRDQYGGLGASEFHKYLLQVLIAIGTMAEGVLQQSNLVNAGNVTLYKNARNACMTVLVGFFNQIHSYPWSRNEIEALFDIFIWPQLEKLPNDCVYNSTNLLRLFAAWGKHQRYFVLLTKHRNGDPSYSPLPYLMKLLLGPKTKRPIQIVVLEIIEKMLLLDDNQPDNDDEKWQPIECSSVTPVDEAHVKSLELPYELNFGSSILLPYIPNILERFKLTLMHKNKDLPKRDLLILSRTTEMVADSETCSKLLSLMLPILVKKSRQGAGEEQLTQMLVTINNLLLKIEEPQSYVREIAPLFEQINAIEPRKQLCQILVGIGKRLNDASLIEMATVVCDLNAMDRRWIEQPDYEKRLSAYRKIHDLLESDSLTLDLGLLVIYHSFYFIKYDKDLALRDSASDHLKRVVPALARKHSTEPKVLDYLIGNVVLNLVRRTLRDRNDNVKNEGILLLGEMARECPDMHPILKDLHPLTNKLDREVDFFDNATHLQTHRHGRALLKFSAVAKTYEKLPNPRTLTQFIMPLASQYLCCEKYADKHAVVDAAIEAVEAVCHLLPWHQYETILKSYLRRLRSNVLYQKQHVRIVMAILDAFHFDLTKANVSKDQIKEELKDAQAQAENALEKGNNFDAEMSAEKSEKPTIKGTEEADDDDVDEDVIEESEETVLDTELDVINQQEHDDEDDEIPVKKVKMFVYNKPMALSESAAKRLVHTISSSLIPHLNNSIIEISTFERFHKVNRKKRKNEREEEEILRVPIALAIVKLLQKLPDGMLEHGLPSVFIKVCTFLRSPLTSVRMVTRDIIRKIILTVGSKYLHVLLAQMKVMLTRGFQVHVLTVTVHNILEALSKDFESGDVDKNLQNILSICLDDIFGKIGEEKEVEKIGVHTPEAKPSSKSFMSLQIVAANISESCMLDLLLPFKDQLARTQSKKVVNKVQECFQKIIIGLVGNKHIKTESLLYFIYGTSSESIPDLLPEIDRPVLSESEKELMRRARPDCYLIPEAPRGRAGVIRKTAQTNNRANAHVLVEFGLELFHLVLKRGKLTNMDYKSFVEPMIQILADSLKSTHIRVTIFALKCLTSIWDRKLTLSQLEEKVQTIVDQIFIVLHKYATAGMSKSNDNYQLVKNAFKAMVSVMRHASYFTVQADQLKMLLLYVEQDLNDIDRQTTAFSLLKSIVYRKFIAPEMYDVMMLLGNLIITKDSSFVRDESRTILISYMTEYQIGKKVNGFLQLFLTNLEYEVPMGRISVIKTLQFIFKRLDAKILHAKCGEFFVALGARLVNDEDAECRKLTAECLEQLLNRIDKNNRDQLFDIALQLLNDEKHSIQEMAAMLCSRFLEVEKDKFETRIATVFPALLSILPTANGNFVKANTNDIDACDSDDEDALAAEELRAEQLQRAKDHQIIQTLNTIIKIFDAFPDMLTDSQYNDQIDELAYVTQPLLGYGHSWVRLNAAKIIDHLLITTDQKEFTSCLLVNGYKTSIERQYLYANPEEELKSLTLDLCAQMIPDVTDDEMAMQVIKCLLYIANFLKDVQLVEDNEDESKKLNFAWLIRRIRFIIHAEVAKAPHKIVLRTAAFGWIEGVLSIISSDLLQTVAMSLLTPLVREMSEEDQNIDPQLRRLAIRVGNTLKSEIGSDQYSLLQTKIQQSLMMRRAHRRKIVALEKVTDPVKAADRKDAMKEKKKAAKKRKMDVVKGKVAPKKKRVRKNVDEDIF